MRRFKQWIRSIIHPLKEYYLLHGRDMDVTVYKNGKKSNIEYWDFIDIAVDPIE